MLSYSPQTLAIELDGAIGPISDKKFMDLIKYLLPSMAIYCICGSRRSYRVWSAWSEFNELAAVPMKMGVSLKLKGLGRIYDACAIYGCEIWSMKAEDLVKLRRIERRKVSNGLKNNIDLESFRLSRSIIVSKTRFRKEGQRWFDHVE